MTQHEKEILEMHLLIGWLEEDGKAVSSEIAERATLALESQSREIAALKEQVEGLRKDAEALQAILDHGISLTVNQIAKYVVARRADSREAWGQSIHGGDVRAAAIAAISAAIAAKGG